MEEGRRECWDYGKWLEEFEPGWQSGYGAETRSCTETARRQKTTLVSYGDNTGKQMLENSHKKLRKQLGADSTTLGA